MSVTPGFRVEQTRTRSCGRPEACCPWAGSPAGSAQDKATPGQARGSRAGDSVFLGLVDYVTATPWPQDGVFYFRIILSGCFLRWGEEAWPRLPPPPSAEPSPGAPLLGAAVAVASVGSAGGARGSSLPGLPPGALANWSPDWCLALWDPICSVAGAG